MNPYWLILPFGILVLILAFWLQRERAQRIGAERSQRQLNREMRAFQAQAEREGLIRVSSYRRDDQVVVQVADNGVGIPSDEIDRIYDPFFTTKPPGKGTGLGLFTCYRTVQRHGGEINVDSQVGVGTSFNVILPLGQPPTPD